MEENQIRQPGEPIRAALQCQTSRPHRILVVDDDPLIIELNVERLIAAGYQPGAAFRPMLRAVEDAQLEGAITTPAEALALLRERFPLP